MAETCVGHVNRAVRPRHPDGFRAIQKASPLGIALIAASLLGGCASPSASRTRSTAKIFANTVVSAMSVQNCPNVFQIKPSLRDEFDSNLKRIFKGGTAKDLGRSSETEAQCLQRAREYMAGPQTLDYLELTPNAQRRLQ